MKKPLIFELWTHLEKGTDYHIESVGKMKNKDGEWIESVTYTCMIDDSFYTRDLETFMTKFRKKEKHGATKES